MNSLFTFLVQSSVAMLLFYIVYWAFLRKETYYTSNRFFLLFGLLSSTLMPLMPIRYNIMIEGAARNTNFFTEVGSAFKGAQPYVVSGLESNYTLRWLDVVLIIYLTGAGIFMLRLLVQTSILCIQIIKNKTILLDGLRIVETEKYGLPFSFFNVVCINPKFHKQDVLPEILAHEMVHIREKHWVDLIIIELLTVIFWFNPIIWFFEHAIKLNHEYLADHGVISKGSHVGKYQALLVNQLMGMQIIGITNNLNFGINTNRLKMMTKQKTPKIKAIKLAWAMPIVAMLLFAFAEPNYKVTQSNDRSMTTSNEEQSNIKFNGTVVDESGNGFAGVSVVVAGTTNGTTTNTEGKFQLNIYENDQVILSFVGRATMVIYGFEKSNPKRIGDVYSDKYILIDNPIYLDPENLSKGKIPPSPKNMENSTSRSYKQFNKDGEEHIFTVVEQDPEYPGGHKALGIFVEYMQESLTRSKGIKGKAKVAFTVDEKGKATNIKILEQDNELAGKGAVTIVENMETWTPGKQRNKAVPVHYILPVEFK